jgi:hypothetical protein
VLEPVALVPLPVPVLVLVSELPVAEPELPVLEPVVVSVLELVLGLLLGLVVLEPDEPPTAEGDEEPEPKDPDEELPLPTLEPDVLDCAMAVAERLSIATVTAALSTLIIMCAPSLDWDGIAPKARASAVPHAFRVL